MSGKYMHGALLTMLLLGAPMIASDATASGQVNASGQNNHRMDRHLRDARYWCGNGVGFTPFSSRRLTRYLLRREDEWVDTLSQFDLQARQGTTEHTNRRQFLRFAGKQALRWTNEETAGWWNRIEELSEHLVGLKVRLPLVFMSKSSSLEEFGFTYTRRRTAIFSDKNSNLGNEDPERAYKLLAHEYFHIASRFDHEMRAALYALIGFHRVDNAEYPEELFDLKITNPDAFRYEHAISVQTSTGESVYVIPITQAAVPLEEFIQLPTPFAGIDVPLLAVDIATGKAIRDENGAPVLYNFGNTNYVPKVLRNTNFIIAPDEILADNFSLLMLWRKNGELPMDNDGAPIDDVSLLESMEEILAADCNDGSR